MGLWRSATHFIVAGLVLGMPSTSWPQSDPAELRETVMSSMKRAATFYRQQVASHGGYVYHYTPDLSRRWGEGEATRDQIWVQPPGTPTVGLAYLSAFDATGDAFYLEAAQAAAEALVYGQLKSGGWTNCVDFDPAGARVAAYRNGNGRGKNNSSLDDGQTQTATRFLIRTDAALGFKHPAIHRAAQISLDSLLAAQFPNGGFPQVWTGPVASQPLRKASYPQYDWRTEGRIKEYWTLYTLNDDVAMYTAQTLLAAHEVYAEARFFNALKRLGDFLILAQMPAPQPAWAQQYNFEMHPAWARRFEPPAISGHESQSVIELLMTIYLATGDEKYLAPIPAALAYLSRSQLPDGQIARYYELQTNRPLYMKRAGDAYELTYEDSNLPDHYGWKTESRVRQLQTAFDSIRRGRGRPAAPPTTASLMDDVQMLVKTLDTQGRWVSYGNGERLVGQIKFGQGEPYLSSELFSRNLSKLADLLRSLD
jgi:PelA/Pel-15E family pectate lyase